MNEFAKSKILVVGGAGFVGSILVQQLLQESPAKILVVDNLLSAERCNVPNHPAVTFLEGSINRADILQQLPGDLDYVFHLATYHGNQNSLADPLADHENNTLTSLKLFHRLKDIRHIRKVVYAGAGCTVAEKTYGPASATVEEAPVSLWLDTPYQISKIIGEFYANFYFKQHQVPVVKARFQNVYGPGEILGAGQWRGTDATIWRNVIPTFVYRALKQMPLTVENGGVASRDFIFVQDIARGLMCCAARGVAGEAYNLASGQETSILDLATAINRLAGSAVPLQMTPMRKWDRSGRRFGSTHKAKEKIGFKALIPLEEGLQATIDWTRANLGLIETCMARHQARVASAA